MRTYRPRFDVLEDRTVPATFRGFPVTPVTPPATHLIVLAPQNVESGKMFNVVVEAADASNHVVTGFKGTVQIQLATADAGATFPASFTFSAAFVAKLKTGAVTGPLSNCLRVASKSARRSGKSLLHAASAAQATNRNSTDDCTVLAKASGIL